MAEKNRTDVGDSVVQDTLEEHRHCMEVVAEIDNQDLRLRPGLFGRMELERRVLSDALLVPLTSVIDFESRKVVYVVNEGTAELREVTLGLVLNQRVLITEGLSAGDRYVVVGQQHVADGQRVIESEAG